eukprot:Skav205631  [mRNA]  locus=scaffold1575:135136:135426:- [translate_table: standard]
MVLHIAEVLVTFLPRQRDLAVLLLLVVGGRGVPSTLPLHEIIGCERAVFESRRCLTVYGHASPILFRDLIPLACRNEAGVIMFSLIGCKKVNAVNA